MKNTVLNEKEINKKEMKAIRNRISAQLSRDRKKKEFEDLQKFSQKLLDENKQLKKDLTSKSRELINLTNQISKLCKNCCKYFEEPANLQMHNTTVNLAQPSIKFRTGGSLAKIGFASTFLAIICIIACIFNMDYSNNSLNDKSSELSFQPRYLISTSDNPTRDVTIMEEEDEEESDKDKKDTSKSDKDPFDVHPNEDEKQETTNTKNALMPRDTQTEREDYIDISVFANKKFQVGDINLSKYLK